MTSLQKSAELRKEYGHSLDLILSGRGIRLVDAGNIAMRLKKEGTDIVDLIIEGEREALRRRYFAAS
jgi:hypothetical protein